MNRNDAFSLKFDNPSLSIVAAGYEEPLLNFVLYGKDDEEYCGDGDKSAEFLFDKNDSEALMACFDLSNGIVNLDDVNFESNLDEERNDKLKVTFISSDLEYLTLLVIDEYNRETKLTLFQSDIVLLTKCFDVECKKRVFESESHSTLSITVDDSNATRTGFKAIKTTTINGKITETKKEGVATLEHILESVDSAELPTKLFLS